MSVTCQSRLKTDASVVRSSGSMFVRLLSIIALLFQLTLSEATAQSTSYASPQKIFGPLACAADNAYQQWISGPLGGKPPTASQFTASVSATADPYTITFSPTSGSTPAKTTYSIASSTCINTSWATVPAADQYPMGPITLSGGYVLALIAADAVHAKAQPTSFTPASYFAYTNSPGSGVIIATLPHSSNNYLIGYYQYYVAGSIQIGCYKEQYYVVAASSFTATQTNIACPG